MYTSSALFICIVIVSFTSRCWGMTNSSTNWLAPGKCKKIWRDDKLLGRCFGLKDHSEYKQLSGIKTVEKANDCRSLCCNLGTDCVSWQFVTTITVAGIVTKECRLGPPVRLGFEGSGTGDWCEPHAPNKWSGNRLKERKSNGECTWGDDLPTQCFGLGPEREVDKKRITTPADCAKACCESATCGMWQEAPGRGCYFSPSDGIWCEKEDKVAYDGGRKCIKDFCGGKEKEILGIA